MSVKRVQRSEVAANRYVETLESCLLAALRELPLPALIPTAALRDAVEPHWQRTKYGSAIELSAVMVGKAMRRLDQERVHTATGNGWYVRAVPETF